MASLCDLKIKTFPYQERNLSSAYYLHCFSVFGSLISNYKRKVCTIPFPNLKNVKMKLELHRVTFFQKSSNIAGILNQKAFFSKEGLCRT